VYTKHGVSTNILPRKCAARESIKERVEKEYLQVDIVKKFNKLKVFSAVPSSSDSVPAPLVFLHFGLLTNTSGATFLLADMTR
jgi:hypothetical protein